MRAIIKFLFIILSFTTHQTILTESITGGKDEWETVSTSAFLIKIVLHQDIRYYPIHKIEWASTILKVLPLWMVWRFCHSGLPWNDFIFFLTHQSPQHNNHIHNCELYRSMRTDSYIHLLTRSSAITCFCKTFWPYNSRNLWTIGLRIQNPQQNLVSTMHTKPYRSCTFICIVQYQLFNWLVFETFKLLEFL